MKHHLITAIIMALSLVPSLARAYDFSAVNDDGVILYYNILSEEEKTCGVASAPMDENCTYTGDIVIPSTANGYKVTRITESAFENSSITSVTISNTVTTICKQAFCRCGALKTVDIGDGVRRIEYYSFRYCTLLETVIIGKSFDDDSYYEVNTAFQGCTNLSHLEINSTIVGNWFYETTIKTVTLGDNVKEIGEGAFWSCWWLESINIPNSVTTIGPAAFEGCGLKSIDIPNTVSSIGDRAFWGCSLESIIIPNSVKTIGNYAFQYSALRAIEIPSTVTLIGEQAFSCRNLYSVKIGDSNSESGCSTIIRDRAFEGCSELTSLSLGNSVTSIGTYAFRDCKLLKSVSIPKSVTFVGDNPFTGCLRMESIIVESGNTHYNSDDNCNAIIETSSGKLITGCKNTVIPNSIKAIGPYAFYYCKGLTTVTIPSDVTAIGVYAFNNCTDLSTVYSEITEFFDIDTSVFSGNDNNILFVPKGMGITYKTSTGWRCFKYIEEMPDDTPDASFLISCSGKGSVSINGAPSFASKISAADINEGADNTFTFTPNSGCRLDQVILNGLDITANIQNNTLTCSIPADSQMIVTFAPEPGDMNHDGRIDISDVVAIVNLILGN